MRNHKYSIAFCILITTCIHSISQDVIFLHHSTGEGVYSEGGVAAWIDNYNITHGTNYNVTSRAYPLLPYPWENYPYDYWNLWINGACADTNSSNACLYELCSDYDVIIFKHCYPGAAIEADNQNPDISSSIRTLANYKLQYRALRDLMDTFSNNKFIIWTLAPLHRLATSVEPAARAREFVNWVKNDWLTEDSKEHQNIYIFDFFGYVSESDSNPINGKVNCLKYDYEIDHASGNCHPNLLANQYVGPLFAQFIINTIENVPSMKVKSITVTGTDNVSNINFAGGTLQMIASIEPENVTDSSIFWSVENITGSAIIDGNGLLTAVSNGNVKVIAQALDGSNVTGYCLITISNQTTKVSDSNIKGNSEGIYVIQSLNHLQLVPENTCANFDYYSIYSIQGERMQKGKISNNKIDINISSYFSGIYVISLIGKQSIIPVKVIIP
jgi:hypothetical protein